MELKDLDCPFCQTIGDWKVKGVEFVEREIYIQTECPGCKRELIVSIPVLFNQMRMFVTPRSNKVRMGTTETPVAQETKKVSATEEPKVEPLAP